MAYTKEQLEKIDVMYRWIRDTMKEEMWYPVKSDEAYEAVKALIISGFVPEIEFDAKETHIRKVEFFSKNLLNGKEQSTQNPKTKEEDAPISV